MKCAVCKSIEFDAMHRVGIGEVHMRCRTCRFPHIIRGEKAETICAAMKGLEDRVQQPEVKDHLLGMLKEYNQKSKEDESNSAAATQIYWLLHHEDKLTVELLRGVYTDIRSINTSVMIADEADREYIEKRKAIKLEVVRRTAEIL